MVSLAAFEVCLTASFSKDNTGDCINNRQTLNAHLSEVQCWILPDHGQSFDTVDWVTVRASNPQNNLCHLSPKGSRLV